MAEILRFQTRARTIDHLGREQIADCPTAISEIWKNAYDAYARSASLQIFDGNPAVAAIYDDGHGMSRQEFIDKWLVIGTESKVGFSLTPVADRNGLKYRNRQGKKGIGRLSAAFLGPLFLLITKRSAEEFVVALIDWRLFENPFLFLDDVRIPIATFNSKDGIFGELPKLYETLLNNVWGNPLDQKHESRVRAAWTAYDEVEIKTGKTEETTTRRGLEKTLINEAFSSRHLAEWQVWSGESPHGTAMLIAGAIPDLEAQLHPGSQSATDERARALLWSTLWSFVDPFRELAREKHEAVIEDFSTSVIGWKGDQRISIIENAGGFEAHAAQNLEHTIDGRVDEAGTFRGRAKVFGNWLPEDIEIRFTGDLPTRADSFVGGFDFYVGAMEMDPSKSTHLGEAFAHLSELLSHFSGMMVFRDGFRVMPYGRVDSDYFEVEQRRSKNAGREFWNHRRMIGRIAISNSQNPNLKDKAGREGIIDNRASKVFRLIVTNILQTTARLYFGSASDIRKEKLPQLKEAHEERQRALERERMLKQRRRQFRARLEENFPVVAQLSQRIAEVRKATEQLSTDSDESDGARLQQSISSLKRQQSALRLGAAPKNLAPRLQRLHADYREKMQEADELIRAAEAEISDSLERINPKSSTELVKAEIDGQMRHVQRRLKKWTDRIDELLDSEKERISLHKKSRVELLKNQLASIPSDVEVQRIKLTQALQLISDTASLHDAENERQLEPFISALESLSENINLELLAADSSEEVSGLRAELDRLTALAQLGITVEIIDHELASLNATIAHGLKRFPIEVRDTIPFRQVKAGYEGLASRLSFLSPLKLSGDPEYHHITGKDLEEYLREFFANDLSKGTFRIVATEDFQKFSVYEQRARIFPVFINLVNNARYWLNQTENSDRLVLLSVIENKILVSDNGPGIEPLDLPDLFRIFFTRRQGGRGIGLYLCRSNLAAGGHKIYYVTDPAVRPLEGASFAIEFRDATFPI